MSIAQAVFPKAPRLALGAISLRRMFPRCDNPRCANERSLWPSVRRRSAGIHIEGRWVCGESCFEEFLGGLLDAMAPSASRWKPAPHRLPIGLVLLSRGMIRDDQLREALDRQRLAGNHRLGYWLQQIGAATEDTITSALATQWACPVFPLASDRSFLHCYAMLPAAVIKAARMLPVYASRDRNSLYIAFVDGIDHGWLRSAEHILGCRTVPCLVSESAFNRAIEDISCRTRSEEFLFDSVTDIREMSRIATSFAMQLRASSVQLTGSREFAWVRIHSAEIWRDVLFRLPLALNPRRDL